MIGGSNGVAVAATGLIVNGDMECDAGFTAHGQVILHGARIAGQLIFRDAVLAGTPIAVQQKLMRHADIRTTMNIYGDVVTNQESEAHSKIVGLALPRA